MIIIVMIISLGKLHECHYAKVVIIMMMMTSIERSYLAIQLKNSGGNSHVRGLGVLAGVGWFLMAGFCGCLCSGSVVCLSRVWI